MPDALMLMISVLDPDIDKIFELTLNPNLFRFPSAMCLVLCYSSAISEMDSSKKRNEQ